MCYLCSDCLLWAGLLVNSAAMTCLFSCYGLLCWGDGCCWIGLLWLSCGFRGIYVCDVNFSCLLDCC